MSFTRNQVIILGIAGLVILLVGAAFIFGSKDNNQPKPVKLSMWGMIPRGEISSFLMNHRTKYPHVTIDYTEVSPEGYSESLIDGMAAGSGPDILILDKKDVSRFENKLYSPLATQYTTERLRQDFPEVVFQDVVCSGYVCGLPLYLDTLALFYNRDYLDQASLTAPPRTWQQFQDYIPYLRVRNENGELERAAAAIGGDASLISHSTDLLYGLIQQNGGFDVGSYGVRAKDGPTTQALSFYLQFGNSGLNTYAWADSTGESLPALADGKVAMGFGYYSDYLQIKKQGPYTPVSVGYFPQTSESGQAVNVASYKILAVSRLAKFPTEAWDAIIGLTTDPEIASTFMDGAFPPAHRTLINKVLNDSVIGIFARQALTARSPLYTDAEFLEGAISASISDVRGGRMDVARAARELVAKINQKNKNY